VKVGTSVFTCLYFFLVLENTVSMIIFNPVLSWERFSLCTLRTQFYTCWLSTLLLRAAVIPGIVITVSWEVLLLLLKLTVSNSFLTLFFCYFIMLYLAWIGWIPWNQKVVSTLKTSKLFSFQIFLPFVL
jgi:hypothetical protein